VRGKCTTRLDVYILKEKCLDQREERKAVALFLCRRREKREKRDITKVNDHQKNMLIRIYI
jgi:hypothetical protein